MKRLLISLMLLLTSFGSPLFAQQTYALKPYAITLPRLTTAQQSTSAPQQAGNVVYNTDEQKMAVHNGSSWQYIAPPEASQFKNGKAFLSNVIWTVPAGVTRIMAEVWGGGAGGPIYQLHGNDLRAPGGAAGGYARGFMPVTPGSSLTIIVGSGGIGAARSPSEGAQPGSPSSIYRNQNLDGLFAYGGSGSFGPGIGAGTDLAFQAPGSGGMNATISYGQRSPTEYVLLIQCGNGGTAYGVQPGISGLGTQIASINSSFLLYQSGDITAGQQGSFPGGGGGCGYNYGGRGADGMIVIHW